jgi:hypothetical protein
MPKNCLMLVQGNWWPGIQATLGTLTSLAAMAGSIQVTSKGVQRVWEFREFTEFDRRPGRSCPFSGYVSIALRTLRTP